MRSLLGNVSGEERGGNDRQADNVSEGKPVRRVGGLQISVKCDVRPGVVDVL